MSSNGASHQDEVHHTKEYFRESHSPEANGAYIKGSGGVIISQELFEKHYLTPTRHRTGGTRKKFANPTPLGLMGFTIASLTLSAVTMGWGGATTLNGVVGIYFFTGPVLLFLATIFEWIMGNFFSMMVMGMFTVFWLSFGVLHAPAWGISASYSPTGNVAEGEASVGYNAAVALYLIVWGFWLFTTLIFTLKTNTVFVLMFTCSTISSFLFSGSYWKVSTGDYALALRLQKAGGAMFFVLAVLGYYVLVVMIAAEMEITTKLPVGDLSHFWPKTADLEDVEKNE